MAVAIEETNQALTTGATSLLLPSWSVVEDEFVAVAVGLRDDTIVPTVAGNGITFVAELSIIGTQTQNAIYLFRGQVPANDTGQVTISLAGNGDPVAGIGVRFSGQELGNNGADAIDGTAPEPTRINSSVDAKWRSANQTASSPPSSAAWASSKASASASSSVTPNR